MNALLDAVLFSRRKRGEFIPSKLMGLTANPDVQLPANGAGTNVDTVAGTGGFARQLVAIGDPVTAARQLTVTAAGAATVTGAATAAILAALSSAGALLTVRPGDWSINHTPAAATQATSTRAAAAAGIRHVATSISAVVSTLGTAQTAALILNLRDGATGAGTILWSVQISLPVSTTWTISISGLNIVGTAATAMTLEFAAANVAASFASVSLTGYDTPSA